MKNKEYPAKIMTKLKDEDSALFYKLWIPLLNYVNEKKGINPSLSLIDSDKLPYPKNFKEVANALWSETSLIDAYLSENEGLSDEEKEIIRSWKRCLTGTFILERILKKGAILISENEEVYQVSGIISTWEELFGFARLPILIDTTLIPFRNVIITDGLMQSYNIIIGGNMSRGFKEVYMREKNLGKIHSQL